MPLKHIHMLSHKYDDIFHRVQLYGYIFDFLTQISLDDRTFDRSAYFILENPFLNCIPNSLFTENDRISSAFYRRFLCVC